MLGTPQHFPDTEKILIAASTHFLLAAMAFA
jgi:hypothetical protein